MSTLAFPATGVSVEQRATLLAIDDVSLPLRHQLCPYLSTPVVRRDPVLTPTPNPNAPDALAAHFYGSVIYDCGVYRMWYYACHRGLNPDWTPSQRAQIGPNPHDIQMGPMCYAQSQDGIHWSKPALHQFSFKGSTEHNALAMPDAWTAGIYVIRDDADPDPARRYKMAYNYYTVEPDAADYERGGAVRFACSPDGLRWTAGPRRPIESFLELASLYRHNGLYIVNGQKLAPYGPSEGGNNSGRRGFAHASPDFNHWLPDHVDSFSLAEPRDPALRGVSGLYDQVHLGIGAVSLGNVAVGLYGLWHNADFNKAFNDISCDLGLVISNDGLLFREPVKGHAFLRRDDSLVTPVLGRNFHTILAQANGILNVGDETRIYHGRWRNAGFSNGDPELTHYYAEVALATLPRDRWGALGLFPKKEEGSVWSTPVKIGAGGARVRLNAQGAAGMRVDVADERFNLLPSFSGDQAGATTLAEGLECPVTWASGDLSRLAGETVRFRVRVRRAGAAEPRLFAVYLDPAGK